MKGYFAILASIPGFFLSSFFLMLLSRVIAPEFNQDPLNYSMAMLINISLWIAVAPLAATRCRRKNRD